MNINLILRDRLNENPSKGVAYESVFVVIKLR